MRFQTVEHKKKTELQELEAVIEAGKQTFESVGLALATIRDRKLYLKTHKTFEDYCQFKWGWTRTYGHRLIEAAQVCQMLPMGNKPASERQARELAKVEPENLVEVMEKAKGAAQEEGRPLTARDIAEARNPTPGVTYGPQGLAMAAQPGKRPDSIELGTLKHRWSQAGDPDRKRFLRWLEASGELVKLNIQLKGVK
jgi:hypothetical protein